jgi:hypothetical protein
MGGKGRARRTVVEDAALERGWARRVMVGVAAYCGRAGQTRRVRVRELAAEVLAAGWSPGERRSRRARAAAAAAAAVER